MFNLSGSAADTTAPVITILGNNPITAEAGQFYVDAGATGLDAVDGDVTGNLVTVLGGSLNSPVGAEVPPLMNLPGTYAVSYDVVDQAGNIATTATRTVTMVDTVPPVLSLNGPASLTIERGEFYSDQGVSVFDEVDRNAIGHLVVDNALDVNTAGTYSIRYNVQDASGNAAPEVTRQVTVVDTIAPEVLSMSRITPSPTADSVIQMTVVFTEDVVDFDASDLELDFGSSDSVVVRDVSVSGSGSVYTITLGEVAGRNDSNLWVLVRGDSDVRDLSGNKIENDGVSLGWELEIDYDFRNWNVLPGGESFFTASHWDPTDVPDTFQEWAVLHNGGAAVADGSVPGNPQDLDLYGLVVGTQLGSGALTVRNLDAFTVLDDIDVGEVNGNFGDPLGTTHQVEGTVLLDGIDHVYIANDLEIAGASFVAPDSSSTANATLKNMESLVVNSNLQIGTGGSIRHDGGPEFWNARRDPTVVFENITQMIVKDESQIFGQEGVASSTAEKGHYDVTFKNISDLEIRDSLDILEVYVNENAGLDISADLRFDQVQLEARGEWVLGAGHFAGLTHPVAGIDLDMSVVDSRFDFADWTRVRIGTLDTQAGAPGSYVTRARAEFTGSAFVGSAQLHLGERTGSSDGIVEGTLALESSYTQTTDLFQYADGVVELIVNGATRANETNVLDGSPGLYSAIDCDDAMLLGEIVVDFQNEPAPGAYTFDLVKTKSATALDDSLARYSVKNLSPLFEVRSFRVVEEGGVDILRLEIAATNFGLWVDSHFPGENDPAIVSMTCRSRTRMARLELADTSLRQPIPWAQSSGNGSQFVDSGTSGEHLHFLFVGVTGPGITIPDVVVSENLTDWHDPRTLAIPGIEHDFH